MTLQELKDEAEKLSRRDWILLAQFLLRKLSEEVEEETQYSKEWIEELRERKNAYLSGEAKTHFWEEVKKQLPQRP